MSYGRLSLSKISYERTKSHDSDYNSDYAGYPSDLEYQSSAELEPMGHMRKETSIATKIKRIKDGNSEEQLRKKRERQRVKDIKSFKDLWKWYWQHPVGHFPFLYFLILSASSLIFTIYWFMDNDSCFILVGMIGLTMCLYASYKFKISINLKKEVDKYKQLNLKMKRENKHLAAIVKRTRKAVHVLRKTKRRLAKANNKNKQNLKKFENIEENMRVIGKKANIKLTDVHERTKEMKTKWRNEYLQNERDMLHSVFTRYERKHTSKGSKMGMTQDDFKEFQEMLPSRYGSRFDRLGTFHTFAAGKSMIDIHDFANALDTFAEIEVDDINDVRLTPKYKPSHQQNISSFEFSLDNLSIIQDFHSPKHKRDKRSKRQKQIRFSAK